MIEVLLKKSVHVETMVWDGTAERADAIKEWVGDEHADGSHSAFLLPSETVRVEEHAQLWVAHNKSWSPLPVGYRVAKELDGSGFYPLSPDGARAGYVEPAGGWPV